ncbi:hypothetical protein, partial [Halorubrum trueperi]
MDQSNAGMQVFPNVNQIPTTEPTVQVPHSGQMQTQQAEQFSRAPDTGRFLTAAERNAVAQLAQQYPQQVQQAYDRNVPFEAVGLPILDAKRATPSAQSATATTVPATNLHSPTTPAAADPPQEIAGNAGQTQPAPAPTLQPQTMSATAPSQTAVEATGLGSAQSGSPTPQSAQPSPQSAQPSPQLVQPQPIQSQLAPTVDAATISTQPQATATQPQPTAGAQPQQATAQSQPQQATAQSQPQQA